MATPAATIRTMMEKFRCRLFSSSSDYYRHHRRRHRHCRHHRHYRHRYFGEKRGEMKVKVSSRENDIVLDAPLFFFFLFAFFLFYRREAFSVLDSRLLSR